jgi:hypothetical protein
MVPYTWSFTIDTAAPVASNPSPANGTTTENNMTMISVTLGDAVSGVNPATIQLRVNTSLVAHSYAGGVVSYTPAVAFPNLALVIVELDATDNTGNAMATYSWSFGIDVSDSYPPNFAAFITTPAGLIYNATLPDWSTYARSAGLAVNITFQFDEIATASNITSAWMNYSTSLAPTTWNYVLLTALPVQDLGARKLYNFFTIMPVFRNGTEVTFYFGAIDAELNVYNSSTPLCHYLVLGNWIEILPLNTSVIEGSDWNLIITTSLEWDFNISLTLRYADPIFQYYGGIMGQDIYTGLIMTKLDATHYGFTIPGVNLTYGYDVYMKMGLRNGSMPIEFTFDGVVIMGDTEYQYIGSIIDTTDPLGVAVITADTISGGTKSSDDVEVHFSLTPEASTGSALEMIVLQYRVNSGAWTNLSVLYYNGEYYAVIPKQAASSVVQYRVYMTDEAGNNYLSTIYAYTIEADPLPTLYILIVALLVASIITIWVGKSVASKEKKTLTGKDRYKMIKRKLKE